MIKVLVFFVGLALSGAAQAQIKCWTDAKGKRACGDTPPPGVKLETPRGAPAPQEAPRPATEEKKGAAAAQETRKPQGEPQKAAVKYRLEKGSPGGNPAECERAKELLAKGGGGRSKRTDAVRARALADNNCI